ncbi:Crp/Fnr family transcriptional regulator [Vallitalea guaymasensis]|uniref:Crp/Fnr family transcriptional regulator n=1 Tax=Vallitalea guaymasensis TaxID=1185412 RepID=UPI0023543C3E|nr:Crp/Fnr family transcriptional regulator [Vallitalea guaymasensis]
MLINILQQCSLFKNMSTEDIESILSTIDYDVNNYSKEQIISTEGEECHKIGIVLEGNIEVRKIYPLGKSITVTRLNPSDIFGEVILFSNMKHYPSTLVACNSLEVLYISKKQIIDLMEHQSIIMNNLLNVLSSKILTLNKKLRNLSYENMRQKIADFLLSEYKKQQNLYIELNISRKEMAETLGVTRPSLSRELALMKDKDIIDYHKNTIKINNLQMLEDCLF